MGRLFYGKKFRIAEYCNISFNIASIVGLTRIPAGLFNFKLNFCFISCPISYVILHVV